MERCASLELQIFFSFESARFIRIFIILPYFVLEKLAIFFSERKMSHADQSKPN